MKYIWTDERTRTHLSTWARGKPLVLAAFFFYERGESLQKSREGLIRSLLHQILSQKRGLIRIVFRLEFEAEGSIRPLSWSILKNAFEILLTHTSKLFKLCIFADGLDEYRIMDRMGDYTDDDFDLFYNGDNDDDAVWGRSHWINNGHKEITELFKIAANTTNVKICLSSRELTTFQQEFKDFPRLRLHDLTAKDITIFTKKRLLGDAQSTPIVDETEGMSKLAQEIVFKAQGVFLWVRLVVDILVTGFNNGDTIPELRVKLDSLPPRLGGKKGLYVTMLKNIAPEYRLQASRYIRILLHAWNDLDLVDLEFAAEGPFEKDCIGDINSENLPDTLIAINTPFNLIPDEQLEPRRAKMRLRLMSRCGGLLEAPQKHVFFMHQTVKEFFLREELWMHLLPQESQSPFDPSLALLSACVLRLKSLKEIVSKPFERRFFSDDYIYIEDSMHYATSSERDSVNQKAYFCLLDELDSTCTKLGHILAPELVGRYHWTALEPIKYGTRPNEYDCFLSYAAQAGLASYVESKLSNGDIPIGLLAYAVSTRHALSEPLLAYFRARNYAGIGYNLPDLHLAKVLLSLKADPNERFRSRTVWMEAVFSGSKIFSRLSLNAQGIATIGLRSQNERRWIEILKIMLQHGANPEELFSTGDIKTQYTQRAKSAKEEIRTTLRSKPEYAKDLEELEEIFEKRVSTV